MKQGSVRTKATEHATSAHGTATELATSSTKSSIGENVPRSLFQLAAQNAKFVAGVARSGALPQKIQTAG